MNNRVKLLIFLKTSGGAALLLKNQPTDAKSQTYEFTLLENFGGLTESAFQFQQERAYTQRMMWDTQEPLNVKREEAERAMGEVKPVYANTVLERAVTREMGERILPFVRKAITTEETCYFSALPLQGDMLGTQFFFAVKLQEEDLGIIPAHLFANFTPVWSSDILRNGLFEDDPLLSGLVDRLFRKLF